MLSGMIALALFAAICMLALAGAVVAGRSIRDSRHQSYGRSSYAQFVFDKDDLNRFGYPQLLLRRLGSAASFGMSFNALGLIGGIAALFSLTVAYGGLSAIGWGWLLIGFFGILSGAALAELSSAYPTAGGPYHWALALGGVRSSWIAGSLHAAGNMAMLALTNYAGARLLDVYLAGALGYSHQLWTMLGWMGLLYIMQWRLSVVRMSRSSALLSISVWIGFVTAIGAVIGLAWTAWPGTMPAEALFNSGLGTVQGEAGAGVGGGNGSATGWLTGVLLLQRLFVGGESAATGAEETSDPRVRTAWSIYLGPVYVFIIGFVLLCMLALTLPLEQAAAGGGYGEWIHTVLAQWAGWEPLITALIVIAIGLSGTQNLHALSRSMFAAARDRGLAARNQLSRVSARTGKPVFAITLSTLSSGPAGIAYFAVLGEGETSIRGIAAFALIAVQLACAIPLGLRLLGNKKQRALDGSPWHLGRISRWVGWAAWISMLASAAGCILLLSAGAGAAAASISIAAWLLSVTAGRSFQRKLYASSVKSRAELQRIERKFGPLFTDGK